MHRLAGQELGVLDAQGRPTSPSRALLLGEQPALIENLLKNIEAELSETEEFRGCSEASPSHLEKGCFALERGVQVQEGIGSFCTVQLDSSSFGTVSNS